MIIGIDPGLEKSAIVELSGDVLGNVFWRDNDDVLGYLSGPHNESTHLAIEMIQSYGMPVGKDVLHTCRWIGRFEDRWCSVHGRTAHLLCRKSGCGIFPGIASHICHSNKATDGTIRKAIVDMFPRTGGGADPSIGTKSDPGPLYSIRDGPKDSSKHTWQALAVAIVAQEVLSSIGEL